MTVATLAAVALAFGLASAAAAQTGPGDPVVATLDGAKVYLSDLDSRWRDQDPGSQARVRQEEYELRRRALDSIVGAFLLDREAKKHGTSIDKLLETELPKRMPVATEAEILEAYTRGGFAAQGVSMDQVRDAIAESIDKRRNRNDALFRYLDELRAGAPGLNVTFDAPRQNVRVLASDRVAGKPGARVEVVEFGDFQCPICRSMVPTLKRLQAEHRDDVRLVWKDFPLAGHPDARPAAEAARCAGDQGKFWEYHDRLYENQAALSKGRLKDYAKQLKLDQSAFSSCLDSSRYAKAIEVSLEDAAQYGVSATPTVFINGRLIVGAVPFETYDRIVRDELARKP